MSRDKGFRRPPRRERLESSIEESCRQAAKDRGWESRKMNGFGFRSWPDRFFLAPRGRIGRSFWVEFKKPGEGPTPDQERFIKELRARGENVYVLDNRDDFLKVLTYEGERNRSR